jgi:hypothetical protein
VKDGKSIHNVHGNGDNYPATHREEGHRQRERPQRASEYYEA